MKIVVLLNAAAGAAARGLSAAEIQQAFEKHGVKVQVVDIQCARLTSQVDHHVRQGASIIVAAGGDGTISAIAVALADKPIALGILPVGTLNHFAKDLGVPLDIDGAISTIIAGARRKVDLGDVNGRTFVNNSSIGAYPVVVRGRDRQRQRLGRGKWLAMVSASLRIFRRFPLFNVLVHHDEGTLQLRTSFVFVGNNRYQVDLFSLGSRPRIDTGQVCLYTSTVKSRWGILRLAWRALWGGLEQSADFHHECLHEFVIESKRPKLSVAIDGEVSRMPTPLVYRSHPGALPVIAPNPGPSNSSQET